MHLTVSSSLLTATMSTFLLVFCFLNKYLTFILIKNVLGLPDYVIGELLSNRNVLRKERLLADSESRESTKDILIDANDFINNGDDDISADKSSFIRFTPKQLDSQQHSVGIPYVEKVVIENLVDSSIQMLSISGNTVHFHCSFFEDKIIQPGGNTSFEVVFLSRHEGPVSNTLFIHTSIGSFKYRVSAIGVANPYRLRPFVGAKVPLNSSYSSLIKIYNPYPSTIQLTEIYTTGGGLHLELPSAESEAPLEQWQIPPFETKAIMKANFLARSEKNHTAFIRIKTNVSDSEVKHLILPVEVEVSSAPGIYSPVDIIDFGVVRSIDDPISLPLQILNAGSKSIAVQNVIATPVNEALGIDFSSLNIRIPPNIYHPVEIARLILSPQKIVSCVKQCSGKIVVKSKNNQYKLAIPYQVTLLTGHLSYNERQVQFYILPNADTPEHEKRHVDITNRFDSPVLIHSVSLPDEAKPYFKVVLVGSDFHLKTNETRSIVMFTFTPSLQLTQLQSHFRLHTNISYFDIPLNAYSGKLELFIPQSSNQTILDLGTFGLREKRSMLFSLINNNPVDVHIKSWKCSMRNASVELIKVAEGNVTIIALKSDFPSVHRKDSIFLKSRHYALFQLHLTSFEEEGYFSGTNEVVTNFEALKIPFQGRVIEGSLSGDTVDVGDSFPGRISSKSVQIVSTFSSAITLKSIEIPDPDNGFYFEPASVNKFVVSSGENTIGKVHFDPARRCSLHKNCYAGLNSSEGVGNSWCRTLRLKTDSTCLDKELYASLHSRWLDVESKDKIVKSSINIEAESGVKVSLNVQAKLEWPKLIQGGKSQIKFPLTRIENTTIREVIIDNPSSKPLLVQAILLSHYPEAENMQQLLKSFKLWNEREIDKVETQPKSFQLLELKKESVSPGSDEIIAEFLPLNTPSCLETSSTSFDKNPFVISSHRKAMTFILPVGHRARLSIGFTPQYDPKIFTVPPNARNFDSLTSTASTFLLVRNNLTILDAIYLTGECGTGLLKLGNQLPGTKSIISFDLQEKHLYKSCKQANSDSLIEPSFTVQKSFNLVNLGKLPVRVKEYLIGPVLSSSSSIHIPTSKIGAIFSPDNLGLNHHMRKLFGHSPCKGFGFKVLNCENSDYTHYDSNSGDPGGKSFKKNAVSNTKMLIRPNEVKKLIIAFSPDFTTTKSAAILTILADDDTAEDIDDVVYGISRNSSLPRKPPMQYVLVANVPRNLFAICVPAIPRPPWEGILYYTLVVFVFSIIVLALILAFFDGARILDLTFYPAITMVAITKGPVLNCEKEGNHVEKISLLQSIMDSNSDKEKGAKRSDSKASARNKKKEAKSRKNNAGQSEDPNKENKSALYASAQSWTSFLKRKFVRRDSSGSDKSSTRSIGNKEKNRSSSNSNAASFGRKKDDKPPQSKDKPESIPSNNLNKKKSSKSWFASIASSSESNSSQSPAPPPLPDFPSVFDEDKLKNRLKTNSKSKKNKNTASTTNASVSTPIQGEPNASNCCKTSKVGKGNKKSSNKSQEPLKDFRSSSVDAFDSWSNSNSSEQLSGKTSQIWDSPITMFDSEKAMSELVKQTEAFANHKNLKHNRCKRNDGMPNSIAASARLGLPASPNFCEPMNRKHINSDINGTKVWHFNGNHLWSVNQESPSAALPAPPASFGVSSNAGQSSFDGIRTNKTSKSPIHPSTTSWLTDALLDEQLTLQNNSGNHWPANQASDGVDGSAFFAPPNQDHSALHHSRLQEWTRTSQAMELHGSNSWSYPGQRHPSPNWSNPTSSPPTIGVSSAAAAISSTAISTTIPSSALIDSSHIWRSDGDDKSFERNWNNDTWSYVVAPRSGLKPTGSNADGDGNPNTYNNVTHSSNFSLFGSSPWSPITSANPSEPSSSSPASLRSNSVSKISESPKGPPADTSSTWSQNLLDHLFVSRSPQLCINNEKGDKPKNNK